MFSTQTVIQITMTPDQLGQLFDECLRQALAHYVPPLPKYADLPEFLTRKETAKLLRISLVTLDKWSRDTDERAKLIEPIRLEGNVRYHRNEVLALMEKADSLLGKRNW